MKLLIVDSDSQGLDLGMRAQRAGHDVRYYDRPGRGGPSKAGDGILEKVTDFDLLRKRWLGWSDLIYLTGNDAYMEMLEPYRAIGYPIFGGSVEAARWESDRAYGQRIMKAAGLPVIPGKEFTDYESAIRHVKKSGTAFACKPSGDADKALSYVGNTAADLCFMLDKWSKDEKLRSDAAQHGFILQEKKTGCEMGVSGWFGPAGFASTIEEDFEYKKLMPGDCGVTTGEQGTCLRFVKKSKLADLVLFPLEEQLRSTGYVGCVNVNCIIDDEGTPWPLEFTMREGWPAKHNQVSLTDGDPVQWMRDLVDGEDTMQPRLNEVSISIVVSIPPYPSSKYTDEQVAGFPIYGATDFEHVHLCEVMLGSDVPCQMGDKVVDLPCPVTAGPYVLVVTGTGDTITGARRSAYAALEKIRIPNSAGWRIDIGRGKLVGQLPRIQDLGYATGLSY